MGPTKGMEMGKVLILTNSSGGLYDFRNEFVQALLAGHQVTVSMPDDVKEKELAAFMQVPREEKEEFRQRS